MRLQKSRRLALLWTLALSAVINLSAYFGTANFPTLYEWERSVWLVNTALFTGLFGLSFANDSNDRLISWIALLGMSAIIMLRITLFFKGPMLDDPSLSLFIGVFSYIPLTYIFSFLLLPAKSALTACIFLWLAYAGVSLGLAHPHLMEGREGSTHLITLMLFGQPFAIALVALLPKYETALQDAEEVIEERTKQAETDRLTGLLNRQGYEEELDNAWRQCEKLGEMCTLIMVDIDYFKQYNDALGHPAGDSCLQTVAKALEKVANKQGFKAARYGGEEFALVGTVGAAETAELISHQVVRAIRDRKIKHPTPDTAGQHLTVSVGYATSFTSGKYIRELSHNADAALYQAKRSGRNCVRQSIGQAA